VVLPSEYTTSDTTPKVKRTGPAPGEVHYEFRYVPNPYKALGNKELKPRNSRFCFLKYRRRFGQAKGLFNNATAMLWKSPMEVFTKATRGSATMNRRNKNKPVSRLVDTKLRMRVLANRRCGNDEVGGNGSAEFQRLTTRRGRLADSTWR
jgi:hypothetical protein